MRLVREHGIGLKYRLDVQSTDVKLFICINYNPIPQVQSPCKPCFCGGRYDIKLIVSVLFESRGCMINQKMNRAPKSPKKTGSRASRSLFGGNG